MSEEQYYTLEVTENQLATIISGLLFSCSVNIVSNSYATNEEYVKDLYSPATKLKNIKPDISLTGIQFLEETQYEDVMSGEILRDFEHNIEVISIEELDQRLPS